MSTTLKDKIVVIRKTRKCYSCYRIFDRGSEMRYWVGIYEGDFGYIYCCKTCVALMKHYDDDGEGYPDGFVREMLDKGQTPEQLLLRLDGSNTKDISTK